MDPPGERALAEAAIGPGNHVLAADEIGVEAAGPVFLRSAQVGLFAGLVGTGVSVWLASRWLQLPILVGGSVIMENIFNLPGLGRLTVTALTSRDYPLVSGVNLFFAAAVMLNNLVIDLVYAFLDPRVRYS